jgi:hypothetical protein
MLYTGDTDHKTHVLHRRHRAQDESSTHAIPSTRGEFYTGNTEHKTRVLHRRYRAQDESSTQAIPSTRREFYTGETEHKTRSETLYFNKLKFVVE